jgi:hypothetical protein
VLKCARSRFGRFNPTDYCQAPILLRSKLPALFWLTRAGVSAGELRRVNYERAPFPAPQFFLSILFACNRLCTGVNGKLK